MSLTKTGFAIILLLLFKFGAMAQTINGRVYRAGTDTVIAGASVYYGGSMHGTTTNNKGEFELAAKQQQIPIIVSCIGYYSSTVNYTPGQLLKVYLKPKIEVLRTVTIRVNDMDRDKEEAMFKREFIGTSKFAKTCTIINMDDVNLFYSKKTLTLTASCDKPIIIENKALGYTINYYLDNFSNTPKSVLFEGNYIFKENPAATAQEQAKIISNRQEAYDGSRMHFIRALWKKELRKNGFSILSPAYDLVLEDVVLRYDSLKQKYIHIDEKVMIAYNNNYRETTTIRPNEQYSYIDKDGFYGAGLQWSGAMTTQRVGDLLPFEYKSEKELKAVPATKDLTTKSMPTTKAAPANQTPARQKNQLIFEKTYLHTDRDVYAPGDTLWFKAYLVNAQDHTPINSSNNLHVDLISPDAKVISSALIRMDNGLGNGDFELADSLPSGKYRLRAYTNWMRNFGDNLIFEKEITLITAPAESVVVASNAKAAPVKNAKPTIVPVKPLVASPPPYLNTFNVRFYPEGGSLIEGISSIVAVKVEGVSGKGMLATGAVVSAAGDTVTHFTCDSLGMGIFALLPSRQAYYAVATANRKTSSFPIPSPLQKGLSLQVKQTDTLIRAIVGFVGDDATKPACTIVVKHSGVTLLSQHLQLSTRQTAVNIPTGDLPEGIAAITLYDEQNKPNCERLVYIHHNNSPLVYLKTEKKNYPSKGQVNVQINAPANTNLSMAVVDAEIVSEQTDNIVSNLMLASELKGHIEHASRYFDSTNINRFKQLDLLLMTQGWRDFVWRRLADTAIRISYPTENSISVAGNVRDEVNEKRLPDVNISVYATGAKGNKLFTGISDAQGQFNIGGMMLYGLQNVRLASVNNKGEKQGSLQVDSVKPIPVKPWKLQVSPAEQAIDSVIAKAIEKRTAGIKNSKINGVTRLKEVKIRAKQNFLLRSGGMMMTWKPDEVFNITPNDYQYKTLEWFLLQNTKGAMKPVNDPNSINTNDIRPLTGVAYPGMDTMKYEIPVAGAASPIRFRSKNKLIPPYLFINGKELYMDNYEQAEVYRNLYFNLPINKFKKIVLKRVTGTLHGVGIDPQAERTPVDRFLLFLTLDENAMIDNPGTLSTDIQGYYQARTFYQPAPGAKPSLSDYRTTIHWEPNIKTDAAGKATVSFYNAVPNTNVRVIVQGVTEKGVPVVATASYAVK